MRICQLERSHEARCSVHRAQIGTCSDCGAGSGRRRSEPNCRDRSYPRPCPGAGIRALGCARGRWAQFIASD